MDPLGRLINRGETGGLVVFTLTLVFRNISFQFSPGILFGFGESTSESAAIRRPASM
jgi:hypothetical protein